MLTLTIVPFATKALAQSNRAASVTSVLLVGTLFNRKGEETVLSTHEQTC